ncbi:hypothetical protein [Cellulomonas sp. URHB0016]
MTLWMPLIAPGRKAVLASLNEYIRPDEVCPVFPFPARDPRTGDNLLHELLGSDAPIPDVEPRSIVYADEGDPLDLYRAIVRLNGLRVQVFDEMGGSRLVVSPLGSKIMAVGVLLAAIELNLAVMYREDFSYEYNEKDRPESGPTLAHVWLEGEPYKDQQTTATRIAEE